uniref:Uncharacterized protein n=1 Tax=Alexandrium catenella TaxID=2925 RepID=A0A7S1RRS4_ALECA|mmetsp:Transcript_70564/g.187603  ORF Transcript_70564/g.187603 Transcript_70564/m.187603 type:complete len:193 (+) Transcript_70564:27-605(+)
MDTPGKVDEGPRPQLAVAQDDSTMSLSSFSLEGSRSTTSAWSRSPALASSFVESVESGRMQSDWWKDWAAYSSVREDFGLNIFDSNEELPGESEDETERAVDSGLAEVRPVPDSLGAPRLRHERQRRVKPKAIEARAKTAGRVARMGASASAAPQSDDGHLAKKQVANKAHSKGASAASSDPQSRASRHMSL